MGEAFLKSSGACDRGALTLAIPNSKDALSFQIGSAAEAKAKAA
jgi:hypothetical protein